MSIVRVNLTQLALPLVCMGALLSSAVFSCAQVLGIRDAVCDPTLDPACDPEHVTTPANTNDDAGAQPPTASGAASEAAPSASAAGAFPTCDDYCTLMADACGSKELRQWGNKKQDCVDYCELTFATNVDVNPNGDNLACRMQQAQVAKDSGGDGCVEAGPTGGSVCGDPCENYCTGLQQLCVEEAAQLGDGCLAECRALPHVGTAFVHPALSANSFECRAYHLQLTVTDRFPHCVHAIGQGPVGNQPCAAVQ